MAPVGGDISLPWEDEIMPRQEDLVQSWEMETTELPLPESWFPVESLPPRIHHENSIFSGSETSWWEKRGFPYPPVERVKLPFVLG